MTPIKFGGTKTGGSYLDETWVYSYNNNTWTQNKPKSRPNGRYGHAMAMIHGTDHVLLFGGHDGETNNQTWLYKYYLPTMNGTFVSLAHDTGAKSSFYTIDWNSISPTNTTIKLQLRSAGNLSDLNNKSFVGPDGNSSSYYISSTDNIWSGHNGDRYIQYKIYLNIYDYTMVSPCLEDVTISYNCLPETIVINPVNGSILTHNKPIFVWTFDDHDSEQQEAFQVVIDDEINFEDVAYDSGEQTTTEQRWEFIAV